MPSSGKHAGTQPVLKVSGLARRYGERVALADLSFEVAEGEVFGFLGPNGAGKSTAFHLLAGLLDPDAGEIRFRGRVVSGRDAAYRARLGVVFQSPSVDPLLTGRENLLLGARLYGLSRAEAAGRIDGALDVVGLGGRAGDRVATYSGGMRRRLEIARVLLHEPELLVMDEPGTGLDVAALRRLWEHLRGLARDRHRGRGRGRGRGVSPHESSGGMSPHESSGGVSPHESSGRMSPRERSGGMSILLTTHSPDEAEFCDRLAVLDGGRVVASDTPAGLRARIGGDVVSIEPSDGDTTALAAAIAARFGEVRVQDGAVLLERERGHEWIPRIVEAFPGLRAVGMRPPTLADAFAKLTGRALEGRGRGVLPQENPGGMSRHESSGGT